MNRNDSIRLFCIQCSGDSHKEVTLCHIIDCPLWQYRCGYSTRTKAYKERMAKARVRYNTDIKELARMGMNIRDFGISKGTITPFNL